MRTLIIGHSPSRVKTVPVVDTRDSTSRHDSTAFPPGGTGSVGGKLVVLTRTTPVEFDDSFDRLNLWNEDNTRLGIDLTGRDRAIALGKEVAVSMGHTGVPLTEVVVDGCRLLHVPHPSGLNRWWNSDKNKEAAERAVRDFIYQ